MVSLGRVPAFPDNPWRGRGLDCGTTQFPAGTRAQHPGEVARGRFRDTPRLGQIIGLDRLWWPGAARRPGFRDRLSPTITNRPARDRRYRCRGLVGSRGVGASPRRRPRSSLGGHIRGSFSGYPRRAGVVPLVGRSGPPGPGPREGQAGVTPLPPPSYPCRGARNRLHQSSTG